MTYAPIVLFAYNRLNCLIATIKHLQKNTLAEQSELIIFSDGPKNEEDNKRVKNVRQFLSSIKGFKTITINESAQNKGLANSVISGVSKVLETHNKLIVVEDDIITSQDFLVYMNEALDFYAENEEIWSVTGYCPPIKIPRNYPHEVFLSLRPSSLGWGTWKNRWEKIDWDIKDYNELLKNKKKQRAFNKGGNDLFEMLKKQMENKIDSWAIRWSYNQFKHNSYSVYPTISKIFHVGEGEEATHAKKNVKSRKFNLFVNKYVFVDNLTTNKYILQQLKKHHISIIKRGLRNIAKQLGIYNLLFRIFAK